MTQADIGLIGLAVMGQNLALNMNDHGYTVVVYNRTVSKVDEFLKGPAKGTQIIGAHTLSEFIAKLKRPRKIMLMVKAGDPVDEFINILLPMLERGDIIIDGGNSFFPDTTRRCQYLKSKGIYFIGTGISGGEEGARHGPSIMPGGHPEAWPYVKDIFQSIAAKVESGEPCCDWVGDEGAGHYVKMVHNGIEYGDMQLICEAYYPASNYLVGYSPEEIADIFTDWNKRELSSYLIEITSHIMRTYDTDGTPLLDKILDTAGQKGTGKWTVHNAIETNVPATLIAEAVFARCISALKDERVAASKLLGGPKRAFQGDKKAFAEDLFHALYAAKITSYAQGYMLMKEASKDYSWKLNYGGIALMWRGGCIIRSQFLGKIKEAYDKNPNLSNLLLDDFFRKEMSRSSEGWRNIVSFSADSRSALPLRCLRPLPFTMATAPKSCLLTCCRRSGTTSARTPMSGSTSRAGNSSIPTGPAPAAK